MSTQEGTILGALLCCYYDCGFMFLSQSHTISYLPSLALHRSRVTHTTWLLVITSDLKYGHVRPATYQVLAIWRLARFFLIAKKQGNNKKTKMRVLCITQSRERRRRVVSKLLPSFSNKRHRCKSNHHYYYYLLYTSNTHQAAAAAAAVVVVVVVVVA